MPIEALLARPWTVKAAGRLLASELLRGHAFPSLVAQWHHPIGISVTVARLRRILTGFRFPQQTQIDV
jgi:hypothetical protein